MEATICFSPKIPEPRPLPPRPTPDDDAVRARERQETERLRQQSGRASTMVSDLNPSQAASGQRRVLLGV